MKKNLFHLVFISLLTCLFFPLLTIGQEKDTIAAVDSASYAWADSVVSSLSLEEKIAQLLMIRTYSNKDEAYYREMDRLVKDYNIGGFCFFQGGPVAQAKLTNRYQELSKTPLFIAMDAEWGAGMRLDSAYSFPFQMTIGACDDDSIMYRAGTEIARQLKQLGVQINFAPVVDVNNNPKNPVINSRSFGESPDRVARKGIAYMKGLQDHGIIATAKHFPGHGDTGSDSHLTLPVINHDKQRLDSIELYPFRELINNGLEGVMVAHLFVPSLDSTKNTPTTLSKKVVTDLLKNDLGFKGLVITDALDMKGVTNYYKPGEIEIRAFKAGNDILLLPQDVRAAIQGILTAVKSGEIAESDVTERCRKILIYKQKAGLNQYIPTQPDSVYEAINSVENELLTRAIYKASVTVVKNENELIPLQRLDSLRVASLSIGSPELTPFQQMLKNYLPVTHFNVLKEFSVNEENLLLKQLSEFNLVIIGIHNTSIFPGRNFGISKSSLNLIKKISEQTNVVLALFASPYSLDLLEEHDEIKSIILGYQDTRISQEICAQVIMGALGSKGKLPVSPFSVKFVPSQTKSLKRLKYTIPEEVGINSRDLQKIDSIALKVIHDKATPGCQILIAKDGKVIYQKSFGYHTYTRGRFVKNTDLYDLASLTKVAATTLSIMKLYDEGLMDIDQHFDTYLPFLKGTNKEDLIIREVMAHQAKLQAWIPFYLNTMKKGKLDEKIYSHQLDAIHTVNVSPDLYIEKEYEYILYDTIINSRLRKNRDYKYSDLGFILLKTAIENITNKPLDQFVAQNFYDPLGLQYMCFNPRDRFSLTEIVPTEEDDYFRHSLIHGYVHDPGAAMIGGVSGHAGLFSNANDVAILMQLFLQGGYYGGVQYIEPSTIQEFTKQQFPLNDNRRGIGFDKPNIEDMELGPTCKYASEESFGHTGFTGTYIWADPKYNLVYIFLSNRIHPTANNTKLIKWNTRTAIQQVIYKAIINSVPVPAETNELGVMIDSNSLFDPAQ